MVEVGPQSHNLAGTDTCTGVPCAVDMYNYTRLLGVHSSETKPNL